MHSGCTALVDAQGRVEFQIHRPATAMARPSLVAAAYDEEAGTGALLIGELFYREDLGVRATDPTRAADPSDAALALAVYRRGGLDALERLEGEFALILWDGRKRRLLALRDPQGSWPLFWLLQGSSIAVSTSLEALVRLQPQRVFDETYLAEFLMFPNPHNEMPCERTAFEGIRRIRAGTVIEFASGRAPLQRRYWDWESRIQPLPGICREEAGATVARLFRHAVQQRVGRGTIAAHLSGGMDSSAVVCTARDLLAAAASPPLIGLSLVYQRSSLAGEREYMDAVIKQRGKLVPCFVAGEKAADYDWFRTGVPFHEEPYAGLPGSGVYRLLLDAADQLGADIVLSGDGSDELFAMPPFHIADLAQRGRWLAAIAAGRVQAQNRNRGFWTTFRSYGLEAAWPLAWGGAGSWPRLGWYAVPPWTPPDFARKHGMAELGRMHARRRSEAPVTHTLQRDILDAGAGDWVRWHLAGPRGMNTSHPFQDPRLVCFALGLPWNLRVVGRERKPVLQEAFRGVVPEAVRTRREKRGFDDIYGLGLSRNLLFLEEMAFESGLRDMGLLDVQRLLPVMRDAALGIGDLRARERMDKTLAMVAWFDQYRSGRVPEIVVERCFVIPGEARRSGSARPGLTPV